MYFTIKYKKMKSIYKLTVILLVMPFVMSHSQKTEIIPGDSLSLHAILNEVIQNYPSIKKAQTDIQSSEAKIELAKTAYLPDINIASSYTRLGPVVTIPFGGKQFQLYPPDSYSAALNINESIYDFGKTDKNVTYEKQNRELVGYSVDQLKQRLSGMLIGNYYSIVFLQEAIRIKDEELATLNEHLNFVQKKEATGSATKYEILTTKVRISAIENQKTDLLTSLQIQQGQLNSFLGKSQDSKLVVKNELLAPQIFAQNDSLFSFAFDHRYEMKIARQKRTLADTQLKIASSANNPSLNFMGSGGYKNGYLNDKLEDSGRLNFVVGVGLKIPVFDANRSKYKKIQAQTDILGNVQETELVRRTIVNEVIESRASAESALKKVSQSELQVEQAQQAYSLAVTNYQAGAITNLDLLDNSTSLAESQLSLLKTRIDYSASLLKLKIAMGEIIY